MRIIRDYALLSAFAFVYVGVLLPCHDGVCMPAISRITRARTFGMHTSTLPFAIQCLGGVLYDLKRGDARVKPWAPLPHVQEIGHRVRSGRIVHPTNDPLLPTFVLEVKVHILVWAAERRCHAAGIVFKICGAQNVGVAAIDAVARLFRRYSSQQA